MKPEINELIEISKYFGSNKDYVIAGGGNTSYKDDETIWIKASGEALAELNEEGLVALSRQNFMQFHRQFIQRILLHGRNR